MPVELVDVGPHLEARRGSAAVAGSIRGPATTIIRRAGTRRFASGKAAITRRRRSPPTPEPPTVTMQTSSSVAGSRARRERRPVGERRRIEARHVAGEREVLLGPLADPEGRSAANRSGTMSSGLPTKTDRSRTRGKRAMCSIISSL